jgi:hypothetical protein
MTWTYDPTALEESPVFQVRLQIGDTKKDKPQLQDEEINYILGLCGGSVIATCGTACRALSSFYAREVDSVQQDLRTMYSSRAKRYLELSQEFDRKMRRTGGVLPYAGGISIADKINQDQNTDRVRPQFKVIMDENYIPVGPAGDGWGGDQGGYTS